MNKRQVLLLLVIAIALGGTVATIKLGQSDPIEPNSRYDRFRELQSFAYQFNQSIGISNQSRSTIARQPGSTLFASFPAKEITTVEIQGAAGSVTLEKKDGKWTVAQREGYPANATYVNEFIRTLADLKVTRGMEAGPSNAARFGMDESSTQPAERGLTAAFKDAQGKELAKVSLGKNIESAAASPMGGPNAVGRYVRNHADPSGFYAVNEMFMSVSAEAPRWLADTFISPEKIKSITLSQKAKDEPAWKLTRETEEAEFKLDGAAATETLDTAAATPLKNLFSYARFEDVVVADKVAARADATGKRTAIIETFEGFTYTLTITPAKAATPPPPADPENPQAPAADNQFLTVTVSAELPKERKKEEGEKPEDAKTKDQAFTERLKTLTEKLAKEKALAGRTFEVGKSTVDALLKERDQLITKATPPPTPDPNSGAIQKLPGGIIATPPVEAVTPPVEAVTPPDKTETPPNKTEPAPDKAVTPPDKTETPPNKVEPAPDKAVTPPDKAETPPNKAEPAPDKAETPPDKAETPPNKAEPAPDKAAPPAEDKPQDGKP